MNKLKLIIMSYDIQNNESYILSLAETELVLPDIDNNASKPIKENLSELVKKYLYVNVDWLELKVYDVRNIDNENHIYFIGMIPKEYEKNILSGNLIKSKKIIHDRFFTRAMYIL